MPRARLSMRKTSEILRLHSERGLGINAISRSLSLSTSTVSDCLARARAAGVVWPLPAEMTESELEARLYPPRVGSRVELALPDFSYLHRELRRKGVTLQLLWEEYKQNHPEDGYQYSRFCEHYARWCQKLDVVMRQQHRAGEKMFTDFSGDGQMITNPQTGQIWEAQLFLAVLGASGFTYAELFESQQSRCWVDGHIHAFEYFQGVAEITVPDNTKTAVKHPCNYEPDLNPTFLELARHYGTVVIPARMRKPRDKAKAEVSVLIAQRWILAALRNHVFFGLPEANRAVAEKLREFNDRPFQLLETSRRVLYETLDRPALLPLPSQRYELAEWSRPRVNIDYHVDVQRHFYSVPYTLVHKQLEARTTSQTVEIFFKGSRVASHPRSFKKGGATTLREHMPKAHQQYLEWTPSRLLNWAAKTGPATASLLEKIMAAKAHPEQGYRACLGVLRLEKGYGASRLEAACNRALLIGAPSYQSVKSILKNGLDSQPVDQSAPRQAPTADEHENLRGPEYYQ